VITITAKVIVIVFLKHVLEESVLAAMVTAMVMFALKTLDVSHKHAST
jgi:hypothetical protein